jgi:hypothetical protein
MFLQRFQLYMIKCGFLKDTNRTHQLLLISHFKQMHQKKIKINALEEIGFNVYSPTYEDGILLFIFSIIGITNKKLVDIGAGTVQGSSVSNLIINHSFSGLLIEGKKENSKLLRDYYSKHPETLLFPPKTISALVTAENVNQLINNNKLHGEIDLLCIDIDGMDYWIWKAIEVIQPRVVVVEYQDILGPQKSWTVPYKADFNVHDYSVNNKLNNYNGASLSAFVKLGKQKGYRLIGCNKGGWNAFFIRNDINDEYLPEITVENCFKYEWNQMGIKTRFPLVKNMNWEEV